MRTYPATGPCSNLFFLQLSWCYAHATISSHALSLLRNPSRNCDAYVHKHRISHRQRLGMTNELIVADPDTEISKWLRSS